MYARQLDALRKHLRVVLGIVCWFACVQRVSCAERLTQWVHEEWQTSRGLPQNSVFCFAQDTNGFLWFGTENGLVRYDGVNFRVFNQQTPPAIRHNFVSSLLFARDGSLWAGTKTHSLVRYHPESMYEPYEVVTDEEVFALAESADGTIWGGTRNGLIEITPKMIRRYS